MCKFFFSSAANSMDFGCDSQGLGLRSVEGTGKQIPEVRRSKSPVSCFPKVRAARVGFSSISPELLWSWAGSRAAVPGCARLPSLLWWHPSLLAPVCCCPYPPGLQELGVEVDHPGTDWDVGETSVSPCQELVSPGLWLELVAGSH